MECVSLEAYARPRRLRKTLARSLAFLRFPTNLRYSRVPLASPRVVWTRCHARCLSLDTHAREKLYFNNTCAGSWIADRNERPDRIRQFVAFFSILVGMDRHYCVVMNLLFVSPGLCLKYTQNWENVAILGRKDSGRAWHVIRAQDVKKVRTF